MNAKQLSKRLARVADFVPQDAVVADIGSDHAYLPCYLLHKGIAARGVAGEVVKGPFESAKRQVREEGLRDRIAVRLASGLKAIEAEDGVTVVTIAGMGGSLIRSILETDMDKLAGVERLVLQPNVHAQTLRDWALLNGWHVTAEDILEENNKIYEILVFERRGGKGELTDAERLLGPYLLAECSPVFVSKWRHEIKQWKRILASLEGLPETEEMLMKKQEFTRNIELAEGVLGSEDSEWE